MKFTLAAVASTMAVLAAAAPATLTRRAAMCGEDNAYYDPSVPEVTLCYEHAQGHLDRYLADLMAEEEWEEE